MYEIARDDDGNLSGIRDGDLSIPIDTDNRHYSDFLAWIADNPGHGLNLDEHDAASIVEPVVDTELEAIKVKLAADDALTDAEINVALKKILRA